MKLLNFLHFWFFVYLLYLLQIADTYQLFLPKKLKGVDSRQCQAITLETNPAQIGKLMLIHSTNFVTLSPPVQCYKPWETTFLEFYIEKGSLTV